MISHPFLVCLESRSKWMALNRWLDSFRLPETLASVHHCLQCFRFASFFRSCRGRLRSLCSANTDRSCIGRDRERRSPSHCSTIASDCRPCRTDVLQGKKKQFNSLRFVRIDWSKCICNADLYHRSRELFRVRWQHQCLAHHMERGILWREKGKNNREIK